MAWTSKQLQAITQKGSNILVAAAAGSGKTAVLVERIINKITTENVDIDKLLVVTFTNAAATEMRERILQAIYKKLDDDPDNFNLRRQIVLLNKSNISTIHAFCLDVIRNNFYKLDISPNFRLGNTSEIELLRMETLEKTFDDFYEQDDKKFTNLINIYCGYKDDDDLKDIILKIYKYIQSMPFPEEWIEKQVEKFKLKGQADFGNTEWGKILINNAKEVIEEGIAILKNAAEKLQKDEELNKWRLVINEDIYNLENLLILKNWDEIYYSIAELKFKTWPQDKKIISNLKDEVKEIRDKVKGQINDLKNKVFLYDSIQANKDIYEMYEVLKEIQIVINKFSENYKQIKKEKNIIDFNDIEHLALQILIEKDETGNYVPTDIAEKYQEKFEEIAIDEYQDSNEIQEYLLNTISRGNNIFMVGDVKQSIYKFRQSRPELFIQKYNTYKENKIQLYANFRSRDNILNLVNDVFENIMSKNFGNIEYDENEYLNLGLEYEKEESKKILNQIPELHIIDLADEEDMEEEELQEEIIDNTILEARFVANKIHELINSNYYVFDKKLGYRPLKLKDIVILLRKTANIAAIYEKEILNLGYAVFSDIGTNYFESMEIQIIMDLLKVINNPENDIALVSILRSSIWNFNDNELLEIKLNNRNESFYTSLLTSREAENVVLANKIKKFLEDLEDFTIKQEYLKLDELIWYIYEKTDFYNQVSMMQNGNIKTANLKMLFEKAKDYEQGSFKGLYNFIKFIDKVTKTGSDMGAPKLIGENEDVIRIMSIHKSKGLEFPVVFLCGTGNNFNMMDLNENILLHPDIGLGPKYINYERKIQYNTLAKEAIKIQTKKEVLEEEMRLLYVALTRSREKLIITGIDKNLQKNLNTKKELLKTNTNEQKISASILKKAKSYLDWLEMINIYEKDIKNILNVRMLKKVEIAKQEEAQKQEIKIDIQEKEINDEIDKILTWQYPHKKLTEIEGKSSVSKIAKEDDEVEEIYITELKKPKFLEPETKLSGAEIGTAVHMVMQKLDFEQNYTLDKIEELLCMLLQKEIITENQKAAIPKDKILNFARSNLFKEIQNAKQVFKEQPFYINVPAKEIYKENIDEYILVQGIIDLYFIDENGKIVLLDYKTDYVPNRNEEYLINKYTKQLEVYKRAIEQGLGKKVEHTYIYSTYLDKCIELV